MSFLGFINRFEPGKIIKMKIKVFTVSKTFFFHFVIFSRYTPAPPITTAQTNVFGCTTNFRMVSQKLFKLHHRRISSGRPPKYRTRKNWNHNRFYIDRQMLKSWCMLRWWLTILFVLRSDDSVVGFPQRIKALWVNYDDPESVFTEILFKTNDSSGFKLTAKGYLTKDRFKVLGFLHFRWVINHMLSIWFMQWLKLNLSPSMSSRKLRKPANIQHIHSVNLNFCNSFYLSTRCDRLEILNSF